MLPGYVVMIVVAGPSLLVLAIYRYGWCKFLGLPFFGETLHDLALRAIWAFAHIAPIFVRRSLLRRSLKVRNLILYFEGMTGIDGTPRASMQCRS